MGARVRHTQRSGCWGADVDPPESPRKWSKWEAPGKRRDQLAVRMHGERGGQ